MSSKGTSRLFGSTGNSVVPGSYTLDYVYLYTNKGIELNIENLVNNFYINESLDTPFLDMNIQIVDGANLLEEHQLNGNEKIKMLIKQSPLSDKLDPIKWELNLRVSEVYGYVRTLPSKQFYNLKCTSEHMYLNSAKVLRRSFQDTIGTLIKKICRDIKIKPKFINESSKNVIKGIYPSIKPIQAANWLMRNAFEDGTPFYFYETVLNGIHFDSYKSFIDKEIYKTFDYKPQIEKSLGSDESFDEISKRVRKITGPLNMSQLSSVNQGAYSSSLFTVDIATKEFKESTYTYGKNLKLNKNQPFNTNHKIFDREYNQLYESKNHYVSLNSKAFQQGNYHTPLDQTLLINEAYLKNINFNVLQITIPGDFELEVGSKINLEVVKATTSEHLGDAASMKDKYLSGTYLVNAISHVFNEEFIQMVEIKRDSLGVDINAK
jgi:hypothetical protein